MKTLEFWAPIIFSIPLTIVCLILGLAPVGVGHGDALPLIILFPYSILMEMLGDALGFSNTSLFFIVPLVLQFPIYGIAIAIAGKRGKLRLVAATLLVMHLLAAAYPAFDTAYS